MDNKALYQQVIIDHARKPRHCYHMQEPTSLASGKNPVCGDDVTVFLKTNDGKVAEVSFQGTGCAICMASASLMSEWAEGKSQQEVLGIITDFIEMQTEDLGKDYGDSLGKCSILEGVKHYPLRIKCATLSWHALKAAIESESTKTDNNTVSTE
jgi:nitrogen fixation NifU-like protein